jgi:hypothetical protein
MDQALATFPGVQQIVSFHGTLQHGITPSVFQLTIAPQKGRLPTDGDLVIVMGKEKITLKDCCIDSVSYQFNSGGFLVGLNIKDRRWKWEYGAVSGCYNQTDDAGEIIDGTGANDKTPAVENSERTPKQLAKELLRAMGEANYDINDLPDDIRPKCNWDETNPAKALADICEACGCRVVFEFGKNRLAIRKLGKGKPLPDRQFIDAQLDVDPPEKPDKIAIVTAPVQVQMDWELEAIGLDKDGEWKKINDLSYKPAAGWGSVDLDYFAQLSADADPTVRNLAAETVYRCYRIVLPKTIPVMYEDGKVVSLPLKKRQQIDLLNLQIDRDDIDGEKRKVRREAWSYGIWFVPDPKDWMSTLETGVGNSSATHEYITTKKDARLVTVGFSIDTEQRMIRFSSPVYKMDTFGSILPADLRLRTACHVRNADSGGIVRAFFAKATPGKKRKTPTLSDIHDDLEPTVIQKYRAGFVADKIETNADDIKPGAIAYADHLIREMGIEEPASKKYPGIIAQELDGALQSITWEISQSGAFTTIQRNQDNGSRTAEPYSITRQRERRVALADAMKKGLTDHERMLMLHDKHLLPPGSK